MLNLITKTKMIYSYLSPLELWELLKVRIREFSSGFSKTVASERKMYKENLQKLFEEMQSNLMVKGESPYETLLNNIDQVKKELDSFDHQEVLQAAFRCKCNWSQGGELPTKYFFNLEK